MTPDHTPNDLPRIAPLVMTALFDAQSFALFDDLRRRFFPPALNHLPAHATLFHHLPGEELRAIRDSLAAVAARTAPLHFTSARTLFLGRGVALALDAPGLVDVRARIARDWRERLTPQDRQPYRPHVTIQNKVAASEARETQAMLAGLLPITGTIDGIVLWHYRGGPWEEAARLPFTASCLKQP